MDRVGADLLAGELWRRRREPGEQGARRGVVSPVARRSIMSCELKTSSGRPAAPREPLTAPDTTKAINIGLVLKTTFGGSRSAGAAILKVAAAAGTTMKIASTSR